MVKRRRERYAFHWLDMLPAKMYFIYNLAFGENTPQRRSSRDATNGGDKVSILNT
jgi:hypothetical protein